ncbi:hypothetical protein ACFWY9_14040 [Amycolatopsis sp. NPDC059027]|uniref:hypothetical protein n=1 Tax=unclassified Amycolatopsis TaxID=2618356 RepID=UPI003671644F
MNRTRLGAALAALPLAASLFMTGGSALATNGLIYVCQSASTLGSGPSFPAVIGNSCTGTPDSGMGVIVDKLDRINYSCSVVQGVGTQGVLIVHGNHCRAG